MRQRARAQWAVVVVIYPESRLFLNRARTLHIVFNGRERDPYPHDAESGRMSLRSED